MTDYWNLRMKDALACSSAAPTAEIRDLHRRMAEHYHAMQLLACSRFGDANAGRMEHKFQTRQLDARRPWGSKAGRAYS